MSLTPGTSADHRPALVSADRGHQGSITPLVIGMVLCLLILGVGVIAAGSAVLARRNLQSACDGAASAVAGTLTLDQLTSAAAGAWDSTLTSYLARRVPGAIAVSGASPTAVLARCEADSRIAFGALFGAPTVRQSVDSVGRVSRA